MPEANTSHRTASPNQPGACWVSPYTGCAHKLAEVKHTLYHPMLPTLRRMEMDTIAHKLSDQHSRTSTPCGQGEHRDIQRTPWAPCVDIQRTQWASLGIMRGYTACPVAPPVPAMTWQECPCFTKAADDWSRSLSASGEFQLRDVKKPERSLIPFSLQEHLPQVIQVET
uniref:Uncharacterized protein n=1 Tax=Leptobrachium leishanense TaxID=445787 RepID=A0A8C5WI54_9ANUR